MSIKLLPGVYYLIYSVSPNLLLYICKADRGKST